MKRPVVNVDRLERGRMYRVTYVPPGRPEMSVEARFLGLTVSEAGPYGGVLMSSWAVKGSPFSAQRIEPVLLVSVEKIVEEAA